MNRHLGILADNYELDYANSGAISRPKVQQGSYLYSPYNVIPREKVHHSDEKIKVEGDISYPEGFTLKDIKKVFNVKDMGNLEQEEEVKPIKKSKRSKKKKSKSSIISSPAEILDTLVLIPRHWHLFCKVIIFPLSP